MFDPVKNMPDLLVRHFLEENVEALQGIIYSYVVRSGLVHGEEIRNMVMEIFNEALDPATGNILWHNEGPVAGLAAGN